MIDLPMDGLLPDGASNNHHLGTLDAVRGAVHLISKGADMARPQVLSRTPVHCALRRYWRSIELRAHCSGRTAAADVKRPLQIATVHATRGESSRPRPAALRTSQRRLQTSHSLPMTARTCSSGAEEARKMPEYGLLKSRIR